MQEASTHALHMHALLNVLTNHVVKAVVIVATHVAALVEAVADEAVAEIRLFTHNNNSGGQRTSRGRVLKTFDVSKFIKQKPSCRHQHEFLLQSTNLLSLVWIKNLHSR